LHLRQQMVVPALLVDLYELTMGQSYLEEGLARESATFSLFARHLPAHWGYFVAAGLDGVLDFLEALRFSSDDLSYLNTIGLFSAHFLDQLGQLRFSGSVRALPEGTIFFPQEPLLEVTAPLLEAQLVETAVLNQVHFQTLVASKAARCVQAAQGRRLVDFGLRRTHGSDAGLKVARSTYLAGFNSTSNVLAGQCYGIPIAGTMAHSFIQSFSDELTAFRAYARSFPDACVLLVDTYDTLEGTRRAALVGRELAAAGHRLRGVRLDSGDLAELSFPVREILDAAHLEDATIFASGSLDEHAIEAAVARGAPIDAFGVGSRLGTAADSPYLDMAYKLVAVGGRPVLKLSTGKATWPSPKQVWRRINPGGRFEDTVGLSDDPAPGGATALLIDVMREGTRLGPEQLVHAREQTQRGLAMLPAEYRVLDSPAPPPVTFSARLQATRDAITANLQRAAAATP
jgi:nicotinate phosphoribosyltransferase